MTGDTAGTDRRMEHASGGSPATGLARRIPLRWLDFDSQGHVYHAVALALVDEARSQWFEAHFDDARTDYVIARVEADYHHPIDQSMTYIDVDIRLIEVGSKSMHFEETATSPIGDVLFTSQCWVVVWDTPTARTRPLRTAERLKLDQALRPADGATTRKKESQ